MTAPNYNATTPKDVTDLTANLWQARRLLVDAKRLISATALTPGDYDSQEDFDDAVLERLEIQKNFLLINKFLDNQINFAQPHIPKKEMKLKPLLPENTFILNEDSLPTQSDADPYGKVMVFRKDVGWTVVQLPEVIQYVAMKHTHWTFTPETP